MGKFLHELEQLEQLSDREILILIAMEIRDMNAVVSASVDDAVAELTATAAAQGNVVASLQTFVAGIPATVAAAVAAAQQLGATPAQLASFDALNAAFAANSAGIVAAIVTSPALGNSPSTA